MNEQEKSVSQSTFTKQTLGGTVSINDLREKEFSGKQLSYDEQTALKNFDRYRISELNKQVSDMAFHERYRELQIMANLGDFSEFLKEKYFS